LTGARDDHADAAAAGSADLEAAGPVDPADVARRVAEESIILLKNNGVLPFDRSTIKRLAVIGPNAAEARLGGGGSASVSPPYAVSPLEGIRSLARDEIHVEYAEGCGLLGDMEVIREGVSYGDTRGFRARFFGSPEPEGEVLWEGAVPQIDFSWGWSAPAPGVGGSQYSVEFCGEMQIEETGEYTFSLIGQEGPIRMWIADELVVDDWFGEREKQNLEAEFEVRHREVRRFLSAGDRVGVTVHYAKRSPRAAVRLEWRKPGGTEGAKAAVEVAAAADAVVLCLGLSNVFEGGTHDRASLDLPPSQIELISAVADANPNTIAILVNGGPVLCPWVDDVAALLEAWYPGQEGGTALARILFGHVNPSGRLPDTIGRSWDDYKALGNYPGDGTQVHYAEGCSVGYRHFDAAGLEPRFPFGFGLSYTAFSISLPELSDPVVFPDSSITVSVTATNTGRRVGRCVVQLYVGRIGSSDRPIRELRNFAKVELEPGDGKTVDFQLSWWDLAEWDTRENAWRVVEGRYAVGVGEHSRALSETELQATTRSPQDSAPSR
jgi:beta-glucosidase